MKNILFSIDRKVISLYFIQMCSTFAFAMLYASLPLYLTIKLGLSNSASNSIIGLFLAFNYLLHLLAGIVGGILLSNRVLFAISTCIQVIGMLFLATFHISVLYLGLSLFLLGTGINTTTYNNLLLQCFIKNDLEREKIFFFSYASMNLGFFAGYTLSGFFDFTNEYQNLFYLGIGGNIFTLLLIFCNWDNLKDHETPLTKETILLHKILKNLSGVVILLLLIPTLSYCFNFSLFSNNIIILTCALSFLIMFHWSMQQPKYNRQKMFTFMILSLGSLFFWMIYYVSPMSVTFFIKNNVTKFLFGYPLATQWILNINALVVIGGAPLITALMKYFEKRKIDCPIYLKFIWAFIFLGLSFFLLSEGIFFADNQGYVTIYWVFIFFSVQALGELFIAPVGYAMIGEIAPPALQGLLMGIWMMIPGAAASFSQYFANSILRDNAFNPLLTNSAFSYGFNKLGIFAFICAIFLYFVSKAIYILDDSLKENPVQKILPY